MSGFARKLHRTQGQGARAFLKSARRDGRVQARLYRQAVNELTFSERFWTALATLFRRL